MRWMLALLTTFALTFLDLPSPYLTTSPDGNGYSLTMADSATMNTADAGGGIGLSFFRNDFGGSRFGNSRGFSLSIGSRSGFGDSRFRSGFSSGFSSSRFRSGFSSHGLSDRERLLLLQQSRFRSSSSFRGLSDRDLLLLRLRGY